MPLSSRIFRVCLAVGEALELRVAGRAQLDLLDAGRLHVLQQSGELALWIRARCGYVWLPIGRPSGLAWSLIAAREP